MSPTTTNEAIASARSNPVSRMNRPAIAVAMNPAASVRNVLVGVLDVQAGPVAAGQHPGGGHVDHHPDQGDGEHRRTADLAG
jgi:hypothetical protein